MQLRPDIQIQAVLKAFTDVILPALDPANPLAQEQARLCMGHLGVVAARLSLQYRYDRDELERSVGMAHRLRQQSDLAALAPRAAQALAASQTLGEDVLERARAEPQELIDLAEREFAWIETEQKKAAREMGFGDDWRAALDDGEAKR